MTVVVMFAVFTWDALGWYNVRSLGQQTLEASSIYQPTVRLAENVDNLQVGDLVSGRVGHGDESRYYVTDMSDTQIALQDVATSFGYVRSKTDIILE